MAKKRRRRKTSLLTKVINGVTMVIALSRPIILFTQNDLDFAMKVLVREASFNMSEEGGKFDLGTGMNLYGPMIGAIAFRKVLSMARKAGRF